MTTQVANPELTLSGLLAILRRRRSTILATTATCFLLAVLVCIFMTRRYEATGEIQVAKASSDGLGLDKAQNSTDGSSDALDANITLQTQANILQSDTLALQVVQKLDLEHTPDYAPAFDPVGMVMGLISPSGPKDPVGVPLGDAPRRRTQALKVFARHLKVKPVAGTRLIDVSYTSSDPKIAASVVNELAKSLIDYTFQTRYQATSQASDWLSGQLADIKRQAEISQAKVSQLQRESGVYSLGATDAGGREMAYSATLDQLQQATQALSAAESARIMKGGVFEMVKNKDPELISGLTGASLAGASQAVNNSFNLIQNLRAQQATLQAQIATDSSKYGPANPRLADEQASLQSVNNAIRDEAGRIGQRAANDYRASQIAENDLRAAYNRQKIEADKLNDKAIDYTIAREEAANSRQLYEMLNRSLKEAGVLAGLHSTNVTVVNPGRVPAKPTKPNVPVYLAGSIFAGLFLGGMGALFMDSIDDKIQSLESVEHELQAPILGVLPRLGAAKALYLPLLRHKRLPSELREAGSPPLAVLEGPGTAFAEALRGLRTALQVSRRGYPPKVILVTSSVPYEGKTTISANLAALLAQSGKRVLLVEGDMRRPALSRRFGGLSDPGNGLSGVLTGTHRQMVNAEVAGISGLRVLYAGAIPPSPAELLGGNRMADLLDDLKEQYDHIVIDSPPVLAVTDAVILSQLADTTLLVARHNLTTRKSLRRAYQLLASDETAHVGVVLNGVSRRSATYDEYYGYSGNTYYLDNQGGICA